MKLSLFRSFHKSPPLRWIAKRTPPHWCFIANWAGIGLALAMYPHAGRSVRPLTQLLSACHDPQTARRKSRDHLLYRRWQNHLEVAWENWAWRVDDFVRIDGATHLDTALQGGNGVVLLSGHYYGMDRLVDPILAQKGYAISRWANPIETQSIEDRWGKGDFAKWKLIDFHGDAWRHTQMILRARRHLKENRVLHLSVRGQPEGPPEFLVQNNYKSFFLEPKGLVLLEMLKAPVVPCFAIPEGGGKILVKIYPAVQAVKKLLTDSFVSLYAKHLNDHPEFTRVWRRMMRGDLWW